MITTNILRNQYLLLLAIIASIIIISPIVVSADTAQTVTIAGRINMPSGEVAPVGGISLNIIVGMNNVNAEMKKLVTIPAGGVCSDYSITVATQATGCFISYSIENSSVLFAKGYYTEEGTSAEVTSSKYVEFSKLNITGIDMTLIKGTCINGTISLPNGNVAPDGGIALNVYCSAWSELSGSYTSDTTIQRGENSAKFSLVVASNDAVQEFFVQYRVLSRNTEYIEGYYTGNGTTNIFSTFESTTSDLNNLHMIMIKGELIQGKINLPNGDVAPEGGIAISIIAGSDYTSIIIPQGKTYADYILAFNSDTRRPSFILEYQINTSNTPYFSGFYSVNGSTEDYNSATLLNASAEDVQIDIQLKRGTLVQGKIMLPYGHFAPEGGLVVSLYLLDTKQVNFVTIPQGMSCAEYTIATSYDIDKSYKLNYFIENKENGYWSHENQNVDYINGFYGGDASTTDINLATLLNLSNGDVRNVNVSIIPTHTYNSNMLYEIKDINYTYSAQKTSINVSLSVIKLATSTNPMHLTLCYYDNMGRMKCITSFVRSLTSNETRQFSTDFDIPLDATGYSLKAFIFDSYNTLRPLSISKQCTIQKQ